MIHEYPITHLTESELQALRKVMGLPDGWQMPTIRVTHDSPKFAPLQALLVGAGIRFAFERDVYHARTALQGGTEDAG